ncbi:MAG: hypothetical protein QM679_00155 [Patulibacter sp.]
MALSFLRGAVVAALLLAFGVPSIADAATMNVSRRVDPSLDRYLLTAGPQTSAAEMTAEQKWLAANASPLVLHDSDPRVSQYITGWAIKARTAVYRNGTGVNRWNTAGMNETQAWRMTQNGQPVAVDTDWQTIDLRIPAARRWWLYGADGKVSCNPDANERGALDLYACGYSSLWIDNALTNPKVGFSPAMQISAKRWANGVLTLLKSLKKLKPKGTTFTINMHWTDTKYGYAAKPKLKASDPAVRAARLADQVIIEGGAIDPGLHYPLAATVAWSYRRLLTFADALHQRKAKVQWEMTSSADLTKSQTPVAGAPLLAALPACGDADQASGTWALGDLVWQAHTRAAAFNFATAVLTFKSGDSVGDTCQYPGRGWAGYSANLGKPVGKRVDRRGLLTRKLKHGIVVLNPNDVSKRVKLPKAGVNLASTTWPQPTVKVKSLTLGPRSAAVVQY